MSITISGCPIIPTDASADAPSAPTIAKSMAVINCNIKPCNVAGQAIFKYLPYNCFVVPTGPNRSATGNMVSTESHRCMRSNIVTPIHARSYKVEQNSQPLISSVLYHIIHEQSFIYYAFYIRIYIKNAKEPLIAPDYTLIGISVYKRFFHITEK